MKKLLAAVAMMAALACNSAANAADIKVTKVGKVYVVNVSGDIERGDDKKFDAATRKLPPGSALVALHSAGGALTAGLNIGITIRQKNFVTYAGECASVCAYAWLAGSTRFVDKNTVLGFHSAYTFSENDKPEVTSSGNALAGAYLARIIGLGYEAIAVLTDVKPENMLWLDPAMANKLGIRFSVFKSS